MDLLSFEDSGMMRRMDVEMRKLETVTYIVDN